MSWKNSLAVAAAGLLSLSAAAPQAAAKSPLEGADKPARQCFWSSRVNGFAAPDDRTVNVRVGVKDVYQFEMFGPCDDIDWANRIAVVARGSSHICTGNGLDAEIISPSTLGPRRCMVKNIRKLSPTEAAALKGRARP